MDYSDLKFQRKIGDEVFIIEKSVIVKTNIIGVKIHPYPNTDINPIMYGFNVMDGMEVWKEEGIVFDTIDHALSFMEYIVSDEVLSYKELGERNIGNMKRM